LNEGVRMAIIFDLGGVVLNWKPLELIQQVLPHRAQNTNEAKHWADQIFESFKPQSDWALFDSGLIEPEPLALQIAQRVGLSANEVGQLIDSIPKHLAPLADTVQIMSELKLAGQKLYYLSNMPAPYAHYLEQTHDFFQYFTAGVFSARVKQMKPHPAIYQMADEKFQVNPADNVFIDDVMHNIQAAESHGWKGVHFESPQQLRRDMVALGFLS